MPLTPVISGDRITSTAWNSMITEINGKVTKTGDIMTGPLTISDAIRPRSISFVDSANNTYPDNWIGMAENIDGVTKWLHIGGITDAGARRIALFADKTIIRGGASTSLDVGGSLSARSLNLTTADGLGNGMFISRDADTLTVSMGFAGRIFQLPGQPPPPPLLYDFRIGHQGSFLVFDPGGGGDSFVSRFSVNQAGLMTASGPIHAGNSDMYFTKTNHNHSAFGNKLGFAAIENAADYNALMILGRTTGTDNGVRRVRLWDYLEVNGNLDVTGNLQLNGIANKSTPGGWITPSDKSLKKSIKGFKGALDKLSKLRGVNFEWKEPALMGNQEGIQTGFIAQEVEEVFPEWVVTHPNGNKGIGFIGFEALVVESLKELKAEIDKIKTHLKI